MLDESLRGDDDYCYWASLKNLSLESEWPSSAKENFLIFCGAVAALICNGLQSKTAVLAISAISGSD